MYLTRRYTTSTYHTASNTPLASLTTAKNSNAHRKITSLKNEIGKSINLPCIYEIFIFPVDRKSFQL